MKAEWYQVVGTNGSFMVLAYSYCQAIKRAKRKYRIGYVHAIHKTE